MKERITVKIIVGLLAAALAIAFGGTDALYPILALLFFALFIAYAEWCERL